jgi:zinc-binding alcohol dehydrogenase/oxidoreductase
MKALVLDGVNQPLIVKEVAKPILKEGEALVKIKAAAFNRRDFWIQKGKYAGLKFPIVLGSDGAGIVEEVFNETDQHWIGKEVVIYPGNNWGEHQDYQGKDFTILGLPHDGTFAAYAKVKADALFTKPDHLSFPEAAAFPLAGVTAYRALFTKGKAKEGDNVLIVGIGGGAATFALQWALAIGANVYVTSGKQSKIDKAIAMGAKGGANYKDADWAEQLSAMANGFDVIIDSALGEGFAKHLSYANPGARIVFFGGTAGDIPALNGRVIFWKQLQILGTTLGTMEEFQSMINFINKHKIVPLIEEVYPFKEAEKAIRLMDDSSQFGKIVIEA